MEGGRPGARARPTSALNTRIFPGPGCFSITRRISSPFRPFDRGRAARANVMKEFGQEFGLACHESMQNYPIEKELSEFIQELLVL